MGGRDTARSALYTARIQHGMDPTGQNYSEDAYSKAEEGYGDQYVSEVRGADNNVEPGKKFALQAAPLGKTGKGTPKIGSAASTPAPGEQNFGSVPIPGSYEEVAIPAASGEHQFEDVPLPGGYSEGHDAHLHGSGQELYNQPQPEHMQAYDPNAETNYYGKAV